ncbi:GreA/GreB family elongation factor [Cognaticolwellia mytili]|uniref:GreA/GreB family elongation factor n=1 Tax=Cognaticolwellia mytili TaxID=1888913 RepID=UPI001F3BDD7B|nr:GreA/GreB family elongation factor [Cognaticolwellia mytili]
MLRYIQHPVPMRGSAININKNIIIAKIVAQLQQELTLALAAADNAHKAATDDQSVAETQYDTLAIEQSYLAEGQSRRVAEIREAIKNFEDFQFKIVEEQTTVVLSSLVQMEQDIAKQQWFFIAPAAGGYRCQVTEQDRLISITVITPKSPMGAALLGKELDDEVKLSIGAKTLCDFITDIK